MKTQDLKNNKLKIVKMIQRQNADLTKTMNWMLGALEGKNWIEKKATASNISKLVDFAVKRYFQYDYVTEGNAAFNLEEMTKEGQRERAYGKRIEL